MPDNRQKAGWSADEKHHLSYCFQWRSLGDTTQSNQWFAEKWDIKSFYSFAAGVPPKERFHWPLL
jgi:hypothetical protein